MRTIKYKYVFKEIQYSGYCFKIFTMEEIEDGSLDDFLNENFSLQVHDRLQWTGLTDMNGIEIYQNDILRVDDDEYIIGIVRFIDASFVVHYENIEEPLSNFTGSYVFGDEYNNPELLKEIEEINNDVYPYRGL